MGTSERESPKQEKSDDDCFTRLNQPNKKQQLYHRWFDLICSFQIMENIPYLTCVN